MKHVLIRSYDRKSPAVTSTNDFGLTFREPLEGRYLVKWAAIPNTIYNINASNNVLYWIVLGVDYSVTLTQGNYTGPELAAEIKIAMDGEPVLADTYNATYDSITAKITVTTAAANVWGWRFATFTTNSAAWALGLHALDSALALSQVSDKPVFLGLPMSVGLRIDGIGMEGYWTANSQNAAIFVPIASDFGSYQIISPDVLPQFIRFRHGTRFIRLRVVNVDSGEPISLNEAEWEMLLEKA